MIFMIRNLATSGGGVAYVLCNGPALLLIDKYNVLLIEYLILHYVIVG